MGVAPVVRSPHKEGEVRLREAVEVEGSEVNDPSGSVSGEPISGGDGQVAGRFDLRSLIDSIDERLGSVAREKGISLAIKRADAIPDQVIGQALDLDRALSALLDNAVRFTDEGEVVASVSCEPATGGRTLLHVEISDTGRGIDDATMHALFNSAVEPDQPPEASTNPGSLIHSRRTIELMDGRFGCCSELGTGTTVWFTVPLDLPG
jgi:two-component system sensor histidine kinase BarA